MLVEILEGQENNCSTARFILSDILLMIVHKKKEQNMKLLPTDLGQSERSRVRLKI